MYTKVLMKTKTDAKVKTNAEKHKTDGIHNVRLKVS